MKLEGKVAIITGSGQGIGRATALAMAKEGASVVVNDLDLNLANEVADEIKSLGRDALPIKANVCNSEEISQLVEKTLDKFHKIDILVNNVGGTQSSEICSIEELPEAEWDRSIELNLKTVYLCSQAVGKQMIKQKHGKIINIGSVAAHVAAPLNTAYPCAKAAVCQLTKVLAVSWARYNINVNTVSPAMTLTPRVKKLAEKGADFLKYRSKRVPLKRLGLPEETAAVTVFLASPESDYITGQEIVVDGGTLALHSGYIFPEEN